MIRYNVTSKAPFHHPDKKYVKAGLV